MTNQHQNIIIRKANNNDFEKIWEIFQEVIRPMDTYAYNSDTTKDQAYKIWMSSDNQTYVALIGNDVVGTYYIKPNQLGLGSHVANAAYMVHPQKQGYGIGKAMAEHSLAEAKKIGYVAMQFNFVVSTNIQAVKLWKKMGFKIIGTSPKAFKCQKLGFVDTHIMHKFLDEN